MSTNKITIKLTIRNRTSVFRRYRDAHIMRGGRRGGDVSSGAFKSSKIDSTNLLADAGDVELGGMSVVGDGDVAPTSWMRYVDEARSLLETTNAKIAELNRLHADHLKVDFDDDVASEQAIEICTGEIARLIQQIQTSIVKLNRTNVTSKAELALRNNVTRELGSELQTVSNEYKRRQNVYLGKLKALAARSKNLFDIDEDDEANLSFVDRGFDSNQRSQMQASHTRVDQREKEILAVARSIEELASLFQDLSLLVVEQGTLLDRIDYNIEQTAANTEGAVVALRSASDYQKKARQKMCIIIVCILIILVLIVVMFKGIF